jgi:hypothetical protein
MQFFELESLIEEILARLQKLEARLKQLEES